MYACELIPAVLKSIKLKLINLFLNLNVIELTNASYSE